MWKKFFTWLLQSSPSQHLHLLFLYSSLSTLTLINVSSFCLFFTPFRVLTDINPLVIQCVILIIELIFLIYVPGWQGGTILSHCHSFTLFHHLNFFFFFGSPFPFLIFQRLRCSGSLKRPWGLQVLAFVSHFLLKQFFFNPMRLFTVVVLALSTLSRFLLLSFSSTRPPSLSFLCVSQRSMLHFFLLHARRQGVSF